MFVLIAFLLYKSQLLYGVKVLKNKLHSSK